MAERPGPHEPGGMFGTMSVIGTDQGAGRLYECRCGWKGWSSWGHARKHAASCPRAHEVAPAASDSTEGGGRS